jgi:hypothetical protein
MSPRWMAYRTSAAVLSTPSARILEGPEDIGQITPIGGYAGAVR